MNYADKKYSKELAWLFPESEKVIVEYWDSCRKECIFDRKRLPNPKYQGSFNGCDEWEHYPAINTDMALEVLPYLIHAKSIHGFDTDYILGLHKRKKDWLVSYGMFKEATDKLFVEALCAMIEYLVKEGIIKEELRNGKEA